MGLTSSLFVGLSGMQTNQSRMDVIGNNISNVNTYAFKSQRVNFQTQFYNTLSFGSAANGNYGGTNPMEVGTGVTVGAITKNFSAGAPETTGIKTDLAIQGDGMFIIEDVEGAHHYTRDGSFQFNSENYLMSSDGYYLQGYGIDSNFNIVQGNMSRLRIPLGEITTAQSTSKVTFSGDLNSKGSPALLEDTAAASGFVPNGDISMILNSQELFQDPAGPISDATLLTQLRNASDSTALVEEGNVIRLDNAVKGGVTLPTRSMIVEATTTVGDYITWLEGALGINTDPVVSDFDDDGLADLPAEDLPGIRINAAGTGIDIICNMGNKNIIDMKSSAAITLEQGTAANAVSQTNPFSFTDDDSVDRTSVESIESIRTSFRVYDSLGSPLDVDLTMVMLSKNNSGVTWRYFAESSDDTDISRVVGSGLLSFDPNGQFLSANDGSITIDRNNTGAATPQTIQLGFSDMDGYAITSSAISLLSQDGFQSGTLQDYSIGTNGVITGSFTNGLTRNLGQVVMATFRNYEGLLAESDNMYSLGPNSGNPIVKLPGELGAGTVTSTALELSNVDLSKEFINLIVSSTGFSASSKVIQTSNDLLTQLINLTR